ncbi:hypothetical protein [Chryseobacterium polytrichastri]|uniref:Jacalin-like lectin domain-containing protein n=1 Tax=Chryseobacterium polytrichastri TaxID=1302687 RepID=A0A1M6Y8B3_9FLAO|nr:hypothetical protein [Chryseobacterium polytrichastri]SHL14229.1 hypothetical protein SAMN05444267_1012116 [Chryseobacterium polytrichastri]
MKNILITTLLFIASLSFGQVGIGTAQPAPGAMLDVTSHNKGLLFPRLSSVQRDSIQSKTAGLMIYNTDEKCIQVWNTSSWGCTNGDGYHDLPPGTIDILNCSTATHTGTLIGGSTASGVSSTIPYSGGNGGIHNGQVVQSTGVTGLTATLAVGGFANGVGMLTYQITGIPSNSGTASFEINIGGKTCTLTRTVGIGLLPPDPDLGLECNGFLLPYTPHNGIATGTVNGVQVNAQSFMTIGSSYGGIHRNTGSSAPSCKVFIPKDYGYTFATHDHSNNRARAIMKIKFDKLVSNIKVNYYHGYNGLKLSYRMKNNGNYVTPIITFSPYSTCSGVFDIINENSYTSIVQKRGNDRTTGHIHTLGGAWFDEIEITIDGSGSELMQNAGFISLCIGSVQ